MSLGSWSRRPDVVLDARVERLDLPGHGGGAFLVRVGVGIERIDEGGGE